MRVLQALVALFLATGGTSASPAVISALGLTQMEDATTLLSTSAQDQATEAASTTSIFSEPSTIQQTHIPSAETAAASETDSSSPALSGLSVPGLQSVPVPETTQPLQLTQNFESAPSRSTASAVSSSTTASESTASSSTDSSSISSPIESLLASFSSGNGIGSIETDFSQLAKGVEGVLNPDFLNEVTSVFKYLSTALAPPVDTDIRTLVGNAKNVLNADNSKKLINLVDTANNLLTASFVGKVDSLIDNANDLLTSSFAKKVDSLIDNANGLLTTGFVKKIDSLIDNANGLLTSGFVKKVDTLIDNASQLLTKEDTKAIISLITNANNLLTPSFVNTTGEIIIEAGPLISQASSLLTARNTKDIEALLSNANTLLTPGF
ncbi:hypothetical protein LTS12_028389, partial [Elasticomyces elasticus]